MDLRTQKMKMGLPSTVKAQTQERRGKGIELKGPLRTIALLVCFFNVLVALYFSYIVFGPLYFRISASINSYPEEGDNALPALETVPQLPNDPAVPPVSSEEEGPGKTSISPVGGEVATKTLETPGECRVEEHTDYDGVAVRWGMDFLKDSAGECCEACLEHRRANDTDPKCNIWVYCPREAGCFSPDIWDHKHKECWLKHSSVPKLNFQGVYSKEFRGIHPTSPEAVEWIAGYIPLETQEPRQTS